MLQAKNASGSREQSEEGHAVGTARGTYSQVRFLEQAVAFEFREVTTADEIWMGHLAPVCLQAGLAAPHLYCWSVGFQPPIYKHPDLTGKFAKDEGNGGGITKCRG